MVTFDNLKIITLYLDVSFYYVTKECFNHLNYCELHPLHVEEYYSSISDDVKSRFML